MADSFLFEQELQDLMAEEAFRASSLLPEYQQEVYGIGPKSEGVFGCSELVWVQECRFTCPVVLKNLIGLGEESRSDRRSRGFRRCSAVRRGLLHMDENLAPMTVRGDDLGDGVDVRKRVFRRLSDDVRRLLPILHLPDRPEEKSSHGNHCPVACPQMLLAAVIERAHAFCGARVMVQIVLYSGKALRLLKLSIL